MAGLRIVLWLGKTVPSSLLYANLFPLPCWHVVIIEFAWAGKRNLSYLML